MNRNVLKIIACVSMLIDHIGYILFPGIMWLRYVGRIAMPIFAYFIGEGCIYTRNRKKYFLRVFIMGLICQAFYVAESVITNSDGWGYMNILLTFSLSIILCSAFLCAKEQRDKKKKIKALIVLISVLVMLVGLHYFCKGSKALISTEIEFDYGVLGIMLPAFACVSRDKKTNLILFSFVQAVLAYNLYDGFTSAFFWALVPLILLAFYNGKAGEKNLQKFFYLFYPVHLGALYLLEMIIY